MSDPQLTDVHGVGPKTADGLMALGIDSIAALAAAPVELIATLPGFSASRAGAVRTAAAGLVDSMAGVQASGGKATKKKKKGKTKADGVNKPEARGAGKRAAQPEKRRDGKKRKKKKKGKKKEKKRTASSRKTASAAKQPKAGAKKKKKKNKKK